MFRNISILIAALFVLSQNAYAAEVKTEMSTEVTKKDDAGSVIQKDAKINEMKKKVEDVKVKRDAKIKEVKKKVEDVKVKRDAKIKEMKKDIKNLKAKKVQKKNEDGAATLGGFYDPSSNTVFGY